MAFLEVSAFVVERGFISVSCRCHFWSFHGLKGKELLIINHKQYLNQFRKSLFRCNFSEYFDTNLLMCVSCATSAKVVVKILNFSHAAHFCMFQIVTTAFVVAVLKK